MGRIGNVSSSSKYVVCRPEIFMGPSRPCLTRAKELCLFLLTSSGDEVSVCPTLPYFLKAVYSQRPPGKNMPWSPSAARAKCFRNSFPSPVISLHDWGMSNRKHLEKTSFLGKVVREGFLKEMIFYPSLKDCIGIRQLRNDRAGVLDRGNA